MADSEQTSVANRIAELKAMRTEWSDVADQQPPVAELDWLAEEFARGYPVDLPQPYLFPTPSGGVFAEWSLPPWSPSVEIDLETKSGVWHAMQLETDEEEVEILNLASASHWLWLTERVRKLSEGLPA